MRRRVRKSPTNYTVGYGRPPTSSQFQPGQSGNPRGRPKRSCNTASMARDTLERKIEVKQKNGAHRKMSVREAAYRQLAEKAVAGDVKALAYLLSLESGERLPESDPPEAHAPSKDLAMLRDFFDRERANSAQARQRKDQDSVADPTGVRRK
jgi:hypothetical protein